MKEWGNKRRYKRGWERVKGISVANLETDRSMNKNFCNVLERVVSQLSDKGGEREIKG